MQVGSVFLVAEVSMRLAVFEFWTVEFGSEGKVEVVVVGGDDADLFFSFSAGMSKYLW